MVFDVKDAIYKQTMTTLLVDIRRIHAQRLCEEVSRPFCLTATLETSLVSAGEIKIFGGLHEAHGPVCCTSWINFKLK